MGKLLNAALGEGVKLTCRTASHCHAVLMCLGRFPIDFYYIARLLCVLLELTKDPAQPHNLLEFYGNLWVTRKKTVGVLDPVPGEGGCLILSRGA